MAKSFPYTTQILNGTEFTLMEVDDFFAFFSEITGILVDKYDKERVQKAKDDFLKAKHIKRKRIRQKKENQALNDMKKIIFPSFGN